MPSVSSLKTVTSPTLLTNYSNSTVGNSQNATVRGDNRTINQNSGNGQSANNGNAIAGSITDRSRTTSDNNGSNNNQTAVVRGDNRTTEQNTVNGQSVANGSTAKTDPDVEISTQSGNTSVTIVNARIQASSTISQATATAANAKLANVETLTAKVLGSSSRTPANHAERVEDVQKAYKALADKPEAQAKFKNAVLAQGADYGLNFGFEAVSGPLTPENQAVQQALHQDYLANKDKTGNSATTTTKPKESARTGVADNVEVSDETLDYLATLQAMEDKQSGSVKAGIESAMQELGHTKFSPIVLLGAEGGTRADGTAVGELKKYLRGCKTADEAAAKLLELAKSPPLVASEVTESTSA